MSLQLLDTRSIVKIISLNVGRPRLIVYNGATISTGIFKNPVEERVPLRLLNLEGDRQADLSVHGGVYKAVYAYPYEHYDFWREALADADLPWGAFGENFTTEGLFEDDLHVGDKFQIGSAVIIVRQPRMPCYKLEAKFQRDDMIQRFLRSGRSGFYFSVEQEGEVGAGDLFELFARNGNGITIGEMNRLYFREKYNRELLEKAVATQELPEDWRNYFLLRLADPASG
jgi:MOSC domain-containing protein YiiM